MELSFITRDIIEAALLDMEDAQYDNHARVFVGDHMILVDEEEFEELKQELLSFRDDEAIRKLNFWKIVAHNYDEKYSELEDHLCQYEYIDETDIPSNCYNWEKAIQYFLDDMDRQKLVRITKREAEKEFVAYMNENYYRFVY